MHKKIFDVFVAELLDEHRKYRGDLMTWNDWVNRCPQLFNLVPAQTCLVLRPDGSGPSSKLHIQDLSYENDILFLP